MFGLGIAGTGFALIVLEVLVTSSENSASGASQLGSLLAVPGRLASAWMDPSRPLIPEKRGTAHTTAAAPSSTAPATLTSVA